MGRRQRCGSGQPNYSGWGRRTYRRGAGRFVPLANLLEYEDHYQLHLIAPGRAKEDFRLVVKDDVLTVGARRPETEGQERNWRRQEYQLSAFERQFQLSETIDSDGIAARYAEGILIITLPKRPEAETPDQKIYVA